MVAPSGKATAWPAAKSQGLIDAQTEAFVDGLLAKITLEEKVGQMIQADIASIEPEDLKTYPLGSILAGGGSPPLGAPDRSARESWVATVRAFRDAAETRQGSHFPNAQSIWSGLKEAVEAGGGKASLSVEGKFETKPDVAVVVFGETPYAEGVGDLKTLEYQAGDKTDLALLKRLKAAGVPVVAVFLTGRPLWIDPELNASDAFVNAWLPGSEGGGIADVIVGDKAGKPRADFHGKLSFNWPKSAAQTALNRGDKGYDPLFAYGYGLTYGDKVRLGKLSEVAGVTAASLNVSNYFVTGKTPAPFGFKLSPTTAVQIRPVDAGGVQEAGRQIVFAGGVPASAALVGDRPIDLSFQTNAEMGLLVDYRVDAKPSAPVSLSIGAGKLDVSPVLAAAPAGEWRSLKVPLKCFQAAGADVTEVSEPFVLSTSGTLTITLQGVKLTTDPTGAVCPMKAP